MILIAKHTLALTVLLASVASAKDGAIRGHVTTTGATPSQIVVYLEDGAKTGSTPRTRRNTQRNLQFSPAVMVVRAGDKVEFKNDDKVYHNVFSLTPGSEFDLGMYRGGEARAQKFEEPGEIDVFCNIHPNMVAKVLVLNTEQHTTPAKDGSFTLSGLTPGTYTVVAWSPEHKPQKKRVTVAADGTSTGADFALEPRPAAKPHLNKNGEQYGRYK